VIACTRCGGEWATDPRRGVRCPVVSCASEPGEACWRPPTARHPAAYLASVHAEREAQAVKCGLLRACPALTWSNRHEMRAAYHCDDPAPRGYQLPLL